MFDLYALAIKKNWITPCSSLKNSTPENLFESLLHRFWIDENELGQTIADVLNIPFYPHSDLIWDPQLLAQVQPNEKDYSSDKPVPHYIPLSQTKTQLTVAIYNPFQDISQELKTHHHLPDTHIIQKIMIPFSQLGYIYQTGQSAQKWDSLIFKAIIKNATDIHLTATPQGGTLRYRHDGEMVGHTELNKTDYHSLCAQLKLNAYMDITQHLLPQDGHWLYPWKSNSDTVLHIRVASFPTAFGESFVLRLMRNTQHHTQLSDLGFSNQASEQMHAMLKQKNGLILVTGATGSGKSTTLYTMLRHLLRYNKQSIVTLENPVEQSIEGLRQSEINPKSGYTFEQGLRAILRQDPDIIMIGEIRDKETAQIALEAAYTGHLVLSTLHTQSVKLTLHRLTGFGLDPFLITQTLVGIIAQQLIAKPCSNCTPSPKQTCPQCHGKKTAGRTVSAEVLTIQNKQITNTLLQNPEQWITQQQMTIC